jgi:hypothetical protein
MANQAAAGNDPARQIRESLKKLERDFDRLYTQTKDTVKQQQARQTIKIHKEVLSALTEFHRRYSDYVESLEKNSKP